MKKYIFIILSILVLVATVFYTETRENIKTAIKEAEKEVDSRVNIPVKIESIPFEKHIVSNHYTNTKSHIDFLEWESQKIWITKGGIVNGDKINRVLNATEFKKTTKGYSVDRKTIDKIFIGYPYGFIMVNSSIIQYYKFGKEVSKCIEHDKLYCIFDGNKIITSQETPYKEFYKLQEEKNSIQDIEYYKNELIAISNGTLIFYGMDKKRIVELKDQLVEKLYVFGENIYITSDTNIYKYSDKTLTLLNEFPAAVSLFEKNGSITVASLHGTVWRDEQPLFKVDALVNNMVIDGETIYLLTNKGVFSYFNGEIVESNSDNNVQGEMITVFTPFNHSRVLVGYFEGGIGILELNSGKIEPFINTVGGVNDIIFRDEKIYVATTNGIYLYDLNGVLERVYNQKDALLGNSVSKIEFVENTLFAGTEGGVSALQGETFSSIYALHGLVNNRVYTLSQYNNSLFVGTLGGISELKYLDVVKSWSHKDIASPWITSFVSIGKNLFIGTYGAGVYHYNGKNMIQITKKGKKIYINPNSAEKYREFALFGTLSNGIFVYNTKKESGFFYEEFPTLNITSLKVINKSLFIGSDFGFGSIDIKKVLNGVPDN